MPMYANDATITASMTALVALEFISDLMVICNERNHHTYILFW